MVRRSKRAPLTVLMNNRPVGQLWKQASGAIEFQYAPDWLDQRNAIPLSLSMPLREDPYRGEPVVAVFDNLLPDIEALRRKVAEKVGAPGTDSFSLLGVVGRDCIGALQFLPEEAVGKATTNEMVREPIDERQIEEVLANLSRAPLGLGPDDAFRISIAGAQEKTALHWHDGQWYRPISTTPTTHILKTQLGQLPQGIDLTDSVQNEYYCLKLLSEFGLTVNNARIAQFGEVTALVIQRFDRRWTADGRLLRLPQEDMCQALSVPPTMKYQSDGGPGVVEILELLKGSDAPFADQRDFLKTQMLFWLIGATDGHAKNFSIRLLPGGRYRMTPIYDVLTAEPALQGHSITRKQMKLAMRFGRRRHYRMDHIQGRHFAETLHSARLPGRLAHEVFEEIRAVAQQALQRVLMHLDRDFPFQIHEQVSNRMISNLDRTIFPND